MNLSQEQLLSQLRQMDEYEFEELVADVWEKRGWETTVTTGSSDRGIDVIAEKSSPFSQKHLIQAKRYAAGNKIGSPDIQQYSSLRHQEDDVDAVVVVTTSSFSSQAKRTAEDLNVKLIDGSALTGMIYGLDQVEFLSGYIEITEQRMPQESSDRDDTIERMSPDSLPQAATGGNSRGDLSGGSSPTKLAGGVENRKPTSKLGSECPICGEYGEMYERENKNERRSPDVIFCESCKTVWKKRTGIIARTKWEVIGGEKKTASGWKESS